MATGGGRSWAVKPDEEITIKIAESGLASEPPTTLIDAFKSTREKFGDRPALKVKRGGEWLSWTFQQYYEDVRKVAKSMLKLGLERYHGVGIIGFNSPEWAISYMASIMAGGIATGVYTTNNKDVCQHIAENSRMQIFICENKVQLEKILQIRDNLPLLKTIVKYLPESEEPLDQSMKEAGVLTWDEFMEIGKDVTDDQLASTVQGIKPGHCASLIYTSGTTGPPKGVMLCHDSVVFVARSMSQALSVFPDDRLVSFLPLSHIAGLMSDVVNPACAGVLVCFAQPDAFKGSLRDTLLEVKPTGVIAVPRLWEKFKDAIGSQLEEATGLKKFILEKSKNIGHKAQANRIQGTGTVPFGYGLANRLVFTKLREKMGLDQARFCLSGAAPLPKAVTEFFAAFDISITQAYGMSETSAVGTSSTPTHYKPGSVGIVLPGFEVKVDNPDDSGEGEICFRGRNLFMGYLFNEEKTREVLDDEGWLHSGDLGRVDNDGFYFITGRKKEIIITKGGENIAPIPIEEAMKEEIPIISHVMVIGDEQRYLTMLLTLQCVPDDQLQPTDELTPKVVSILAQAGSTANTVTQAMADETVRNLIQQGMDRANERAISRAARVQKFTILPTDFSPGGGELTSTFKLKRATTAKKYEEAIAKMYADE